MAEPEKEEHWFANNWERTIFVITGLVALWMTARFFYKDNVTAGSATFGIAFLSFLYSNVARFKKFKGLGFEAELWDDKKKEAEQLIDKLKSIVSVYTREIVMGRVHRMRMSGQDWKGHWKLFDELKGRHEDLGQKIDFSPLREEMENYFLYDMYNQAEQPIRFAINQAHREAMEYIHAKHSGPDPRSGVIVDVDGFKRELEILNTFRREIDSAKILQAGDSIGHAMLKHIDNAKAFFETHYSITPIFPDEAIDRFRKIATLYDERPIVVTEEIIALSTKRLEID